MQRWVIANLEKDVPHLEAAVLVAGLQLETADYPSFEEYFEALRLRFLKELEKEGLAGDYFKGPDVPNLEDFPEFHIWLAELKARLEQAWHKYHEEKRRYRALTEELQYRRLERTKRHRLKRLAEEEAARKAAAKEALKRKSEPARLERDRRKAEARVRTEAAKERARARAEAKRAEWLAAHPPKRERN